MIRAGVDLGTTFALIGTLNSNGVPTLFPDYHDPSAFRTPSVVHIGPTGCLVGQPVEQMLEDEAELPVARFAKLDLGRERPSFVDHQGRSWSAEAICALVLRKLKRDAEAFANDQIGTLALAVPAQFDDRQRKAARDAARIAGLPEPTIVEEPVAAATYYGSAHSAGDRTLLVYDLGGGTFDATVVQSTGDGLFVLATDGDAAIGGRRFDEALMEVVAAEFRHRHGVDPLRDPIGAVRLRQLAERIKIKLGMPGATAFRQPVLLCGKTCEVAITRAQFEALIAPLLDATIAASERCLASAALAWKDVDQLLLAGGSTLVPAVESRLRAAAGSAADRIVARQPHQAVAFGTALIAGRAAGDEGRGIPRVVSRIAAYDLALRVFDPSTGAPGIHVLIARNSPLPIRNTQTFYTQRADQTRIVLELVQTKGADSPVVSLGSLAFGPIAAPRLGYPVEVTVSYDLDGIVSVAARDPASGREIEQSFEEGGETEAGRHNRERALVMSMRINE